MRISYHTIMELTDTHCHIHEAASGLKGATPTHAIWAKAGKLNPDDMIAHAHADGVTRMVCVGTTLADSELAVDFVQTRPDCWASIGIHPHEAGKYVDNTTALQDFAALATKPKVVAIGECGLDYFYNHSPAKAQEKILRFQFELANRHNLPMIFHVRDAFDAFWPVFDDYPGTRGIVHSFTATTKELEQALQRNLYVGLNGIMTFTKNPEQLAAAKAVPLNKLVLETDAPFLTPVPFRGKICEPRHVRVTGEFLGHLRGETLEQIATVTTQNARKLLGL